MVAVAPGITAPEGSVTVTLSVLDPAVVCAGSAASGKTHDPIHANNKRLLGLHIQLLLQHSQSLRYYGVKARTELGAPGWKRQRGNARCGETRVPNYAAIRVRTTAAHAPSSYFGPTADAQSDKNRSNENRYVRERRRRWPSTPAACTR